MVGVFDFAVGTYKAIFVPLGVIPKFLADDDEESSPGNFKGIFVLLVVILKFLADFD